MNLDNKAIELLKTLEAIVLAGGEILKTFQGKITNEPKESDLPSNKVDKSSTAHTLLDDLVQEVSLEILRINFPYVTINVEEKTSRVGFFSKNSSNICFHLDPLDGTYAFLQGMKEYTTGAAFSYKKEFIASAIYFPAYDRLYSATKGRGIQVKNSKTEKLPFVRKRVPEKKFTHKRCKELVAIAEKLGLKFDGSSKSAHNTMIAVAEGSLSMQMYHLASPHDFGIPQLFVEEVGGICTDLRGNKIKYSNDYRRLDYFLAFYDDKIKERFFESFLPD